MSKTTHLMFCNLVTVPDGTVTVDILFGDTITDAAGNPYRVEFVDDAGGQGEHLEIQLCLLQPGGD